MASETGFGPNRGEFHWHWCFQGEFGQLAVERLREFNASLPRCPCNAIPADMPFVRLSWLLEQGTDLRQLPRLQDLPREALVFPDEMSVPYFVSHRWLARDHPDRSGEQMAVALARTWAYNLASPTAQARRAGVWYDYMCLPQEPRNAHDRALLTRLLPRVFLLPAVSHPIVVLNGEHRLASRARCVAEAVAALLNGRHWEVASLSMQNVIYPALATTDTPIADMLDSKTAGYEAGLAKLRRWLREAGPVSPIDRERLLHEGGNWKHCVDVVNRAPVDLRLMIGRDRTRIPDDGQLLVLAAELALETTEEEDLLRCMRAMVSAVRNYEDLAT